MQEKNNGEGFYEAPAAINTDPRRGLTREMVDERIICGLDNREITPPTKTVGQIIRSNTLTYFNLVFTVLAVGICIAGSWKNLTFMGVVLANTLIGIFQELKSKRTLDKMALLTAQKCTVIRDGREVQIDTHRTVRDDIAVFSAGSQIYADAVVVEGECIVNEALITGEADEIRKKPGDRLVSGSFVMSGKCLARLYAVGSESFASRLTIEAKKSKAQSKGEMMLSLSRLVKWIGILLIPLGAVMLVKEISWLGQDYREGIISTVAALIGMIPEGLYLLTSLALLTSIVRLAKKNTLVHEMSCIETLARVDVLCVDKTGTVTENKMTVEDVVPLVPDRIPKEEVFALMADYVYSMQADNDTMIALKKYFTGNASRTSERVYPFTSSRKFGAAVFSGGEVYLLGAPDVILGDSYPKFAPLIDRYSEKGCRVLLLARYGGDPEVLPLTGTVAPVSLVLLANRIRENAPAAFEFFARQGVEIKVISGDNAMAVSRVASRAGIAGAERYIDARTLDTDEKIDAAANEYTVFGRVTPEQKRKLVRAIKKAGHTVAMTGDGVNDVLALKEADCSVAMASGSDIASQAANIVLLDSDFSSMPEVVMEGRRVINNIERSASLYLTKNIFSFALTLLTLFFALPYPLEPSQLSLISALTIGIPSFFLALEPNESIVRGHFLKNVLYRSLPAAITNLIMNIGIILFYIAFGIPKDEMSTICAVVMGIVGMMMLFYTSLPFNRMRKILFVTMGTAFLLCAVFLSSFFSLVPLSFQGWLILAVFAALSVPTYMAVHRAVIALGNAFSVLRRKIAAAKDA